MAEFNRAMGVDPGLAQTGYAVVEVSDKLGLSKKVARLNPIAVITG